MGSAFSGLIFQIKRLYVSKQCMQLSSTVNITGETILLNKDIPSLLRGKSLLYATLLYDGKIRVYVTFICFVLTV